MAMAIEFIQIHNVVRTYQRAIHLPLFKRQDAEQTGDVRRDQISIFPSVRKLNAMRVIGEVLSVIH
jgi:hypothetical protein